MITAIKPIYDNFTQKFNLHVVRDADILLAHSGYLVFDNPVRMLAKFREGTAMTSWTARKKAIVTAWFEAEVAGLSEAELTQFADTRYAVQLK